MTTIRCRWVAGLLTVLTSVVLVSISAPGSLAEPEAAAANSARPKLHVALENKDLCVKLSENVYYGRSETKCPKHKWNPLKGCRADGCCCKDACSTACRKAYCRLKKEWTIDPDNYCGQNMECPKEWTCGED